MTSIRVFELHVMDLFRIIKFDSWKQVRKIENRTIHFSRHIMCSNRKMKNTITETISANSKLLVHYKKDIYE